MRKDRTLQAAALLVGALFWPAQAAAQAPEPRAPAAEAGCDDLSYLSRISQALGVSDAPEQAGACFDGRIHVASADAEQVMLSDNVRLIVSVAALYRVVDSDAFAATVRGRAAGEQRLADLLTRSLRSVLGRAVLAQVIVERRAELAGQIRDQVAAETAQFGVEVLEARLSDVALPQANASATFARMAAERQSAAAQIIEKARAPARRRRAQADGEAFQITAEARLAAAERLAQAAAERAQIAAEAYATDPEFFAIYRTLQGGAPDPAGLQETGGAE